MVSSLPSFDVSLAAVGGYCGIRSPALRIGLDDSEEVRKRDVRSRGKNKRAVATGTLRAPCLRFPPRVALSYTVTLEVHAVDLCWPQKDGATRLWVAPFALIARRGDWI